MADETTKTMTVESAIAQVKERLFATEAEVKVLMEDKRDMRVQTESKDERFWGLNIGDNMFVFTNHCLDFLPNRTWGRVGIHKDGVMKRAETVELLKKSHDAYLEYYKPKEENKDVQHHVQEG